MPPIRIRPRVRTVLSVMLASCSTLLIQYLFDANSRRLGTLHGGDEDCLFLNVFTPASAAGLPVVVWIRKQVPVSASAFCDTRLNYL